MANSKPKAFLISLFFLCGWGIGSLTGQEPPSSRESTQPRGQTSSLEARNPLNRVVWEFGMEGFGPGHYQDAVKALISAFEEERGFKIQPGTKGRVGLKVYTNSGAGISTPVSLVQAVIETLIDRGYRREDLFLLDLDEENLREAGFIPAISARSRSFEGIPVYILETEAHYSSIWFYDNPLPSDRRERALQEQDRLYEWESTRSLLERYAAQDRKSFLPVPLLTEVDFWINLPMVMDHPALGVSGALTNPTLWSVSNNRRFLTNPATAPAATAEIAAIPELQEGWIFTLMTLEKYQFIGGPLFRSLYTRSEPRLLLSTNPVILDYLLLERINQARRDNGFDMLLQEQPLFFYAETLGLGSFDKEVIDWRKMGSDPGPLEFKPISSRE